MMKPRQCLVQLHQFNEIGVRGIAAATIEVMHEGWAPGGAEHRGVAAELHAVGLVACMLRELTRCGGLDNAAAEARLEAHTRALDVAAGVAENVEDLGIAVKLHPGFLQDGVGIALDQFEALAGQHAEGFKLARDEGRAHHR